MANGFYFERKGYEGLEGDVKVKVHRYKLTTNFRISEDDRHKQRTLYACHALKRKPNKTILYQVYIISVEQDIQL